MYAFMYVHTYMKYIYNPYPIYYKGKGNDILSRTF